MQGYSQIRGKAEEDTENYERDKHDDQPNQKMKKQICGNTQPKQKQDSLKKRIKKLNTESKEEKMMRRSPTSPQLWSCNEWY